MKKNITIFVLLSCLLSAFTLISNAQAPNTWTQKADYGGMGTYGAVGFSIGTKGYIGTGRDNGGLKRDFWEYDAVSEIWTQKADFGLLASDVRIQAVGFSIGSKGYVGTGNDDGVSTNDFWEYDPALNIWTAKAPFGGSVRYGAIGFSIGSKGYLGLGSTYSGDAKDFWEYDPGLDLWTQKTDFGGTARMGAVGFSIGSKGYVGTGYDIGGPQNDFWEYNPLTDSWTAKANFGGVGRYFAFGYGTEAYGYIGVGNVGGSYTDDFWEYDVAGDSWTQKASLGGGGYGRHKVAGFNIAHKGYLGTGANGTGVPIKDFWEYNPSCTPPSITSQPANQSITYGTATSFTVTATDAVSYQWQEDAGSGFTNVTDGGIYSNATTSTLNISLPTVAMNGFKYRCVITGACLPTATSNGNATLSVSVLPVVITANAGQTKVYGSADPLPYTYTNAPALVTGDSFTGALSRVAGETVGSYAFTLGTLSAGPNYTLTIAATPTFSITPLAVVITANAGQTKVYGSADPLPYTYTNTPALVTGDSFTGALSRVAGETVGSYAFTLGTLSAGPNYTLTIAATPTFSITPLAVVITANAGQTKVYGSADPLPYTYTNTPALVTGDSFTGALSRVAGENVGLYAITLGTLSAGTNYTLSFVSSNFSITVKPIVITANAGQAKVYGSADPTPFTYTFAPALIGTDVITGLMSRVAGENAGAYSFTLGTLSAGTNYSLTVASLPTFNITPKGLTVTAVDKNKCYDGLVYSGGYSVIYNGFVNGENQSVLGGVLTFGGTAISAVNPGSYSIIPSGFTSTNYAITYVNGNLVINPAPAPTITGTNSLCAGSTGVLYTTEAGFSNYVWTISFGGVITGGLNTNQVSVDWGTAGSRNISVNYQNTLGCNSATPTTYNVTVLSVPVPIISGDDSVCSGNTGVVYTTQVNYSNYVWVVSSGGTIASGAGTNSITVNWTGSGNQTVSVSYTNGLGCQSLVPTVFVVNVAPKPAASGPVIGSGSVCAGSNGLNYSVTPIANALSYNWSVPAGASIVSGAGTASITVNFAMNATSGVIKVNGVNDCGSGTSSPNFNVQVNPIPVTPVITLSGDTLTSSANTGNQWYLDGVIIPGATGKKHIAVYLGTYTVVVTQNGCSSSVSNPIQITQIVSTENWTETSFTVYPNPSNGLFNVKFETASAEVYDIEVYNNLGALIWKRDKVNTGSQDLTKIDLSGSPAGVYTVVLKNKTTSMLRKVIVMK